MITVESLVGKKNKGGFVFDDHDQRTVERMLKTNKERIAYMKKYGNSDYAPFRLAQDFTFKKRAGKISIADARRINEEKGRYFFSKDAMRFFNSKIETKGDLISNKYFVTSEQFDSSSLRKYSVRVFNKKTGDVNTVGDFQGFRTMVRARDFARCLDDHDGDVKACRRK